MHARQLGGALSANSAIASQPVRLQRPGKLRRRLDRWAARREAGPKARRYRQGTVATRCRSQPSSRAECLQTRKRARDEPDAEENRIGGELPAGHTFHAKADLRLLDSVLGHIAALPLADHPAGVRLDTGSRPESRQTLSRNGFHALPIAARGRRPQLTAAAEKGHTQRSVIGRSGSLRTCGDEPNADGRGERRRPRPHDHFFAGGKARR